MGKSLFKVKHVTHRTVGTKYPMHVKWDSTYTDKFTGVIPIVKVDGLIYEYACHEGNYAMSNMLRGARVQDADR